MSRKLDAWIAENLFDIEVFDYDEIEEYCPVMRIGMSLKYKEIPYYSTEIKDGVDVMLGSDLLDKFSIHKNGEVTLIGHINYRLVIEDPIAMSNSFPMAICLAAYKAKTGEDWNE